MTTMTIEPPTVDPLGVALRLAEKGCDPGLIAHYLELEKRRDPTLGMDEFEKAHYLLDRAIDETRQHIARLVQAPPVVSVR